MIAADGAVVVVVGGTAVVVGGTAVVVVVDVVVVGGTAVVVVVEVVVGVVGGAHRVGSLAIPDARERVAFAGRFTQGGLLRP